MAKKILGLLLVLVLLAVIPGYAMDEYELIQGARDLTLRMEGASRDTRYRFVEKEGRKLEGVTVAVASAVIYEISSYVPGRYHAHGYSKFNEAVHGTNESRVRWGSQREFRLKDFTKIRVDKDYQDIRASYYLYIDSSRTEIIDNLRKGQKISFTFELTGWHKGRTFLDAHGFLLSINPETKMLRCQNGHEYAPSAGYKFCPQCGKQLR